MKSVKNPSVWSWALLITCVAAAWFFWPQLGTIALTAVMAFTFYPLYQKLKRKKGTMAAVLTLVLSFLVVIIPLSFVVFASISQLTQLADAVGKSEQWQSLPGTLDGVVDAANSIIEPVTGSRDTVTNEGVMEFLRTSFVFVARSSVQVTMNVLGGLPQMGIALLIYIFLFVELLRRGPTIVKRLTELSPLGVEATKHYFERVGMMTNAMVKGQLIIAMAISFIAAALLSVLGYGQYFFLFFVLFTLLNFIPLGSGIIVLPLALYSMFTGQFWLSLVVIALYYAAGNLDPLLRTRLIPKQIQLSVAITMIATFCGIAYFGILGVIYGPVIMILLKTTVDMYLESKSRISVTT